MPKSDCESISAHIIVSKNQSGSTELPEIILLPNQFALIGDNTHSTAQQLIVLNICGSNWGGGGGLKRRVHTVQFVAPSFIAHCSWEMGERRDEDDDRRGEGTVLAST